MKKVIVLLLALGLVFSCGCTSGQTYKNDDNQINFASSAYLISSAFDFICIFSSMRAR